MPAGSCRGSARRRCCRSRWRSSATPSRPPNRHGRWGSGRGSRPLALAIGPLAGGLLVEIDWRVIFWINLPVALVGIAITAVAAPESTDPGAGRRVDFAGLLALGVGLAAVVLALVQSRTWSGATTAVVAVAGPGCALRLLAGRASGARADRRLRALPQPALLRRQRRRLCPGRRLLGGDVLPAAVPAGRARPLGRAQRADDPADHGADGRHLAALGAPDRPLRGAAADDGRDGLRRRPACSS